MTRPDRLPMFALAAALALGAALIGVMMDYFGRILNTTPDTVIYKALADNLIVNHCYSAASVQGASCVPTWGAQPPGYALFIALMRVLGGASDRVIVVAQMLVFVAAAVYFSWVVFRSHRSPILFVAIVAAELFSPASLGVSHFVTTEYLASAASLLLFAELVRCLQERRMRVAAVAAAVIFGMIVRWDQINLLIPVVAVAVLSFGAAYAARKVAVIAAICAVPYLALIVRAAVVGLPLLPSAVPDESSLPRSMLAFYRVAALDYRANMNFEWPYVGLHYSRVRLENDPVCVPGMPPGSIVEYSDRVDPYRLCTLIKRVNRLADGEALPPELDAEFSALARDAGADWSTAISVPFQRAIRTWWAWLGHPLWFLETGRNFPIKQIFIGYYVLIGLGLLVGCFANDPIVRTISVAALVFLIGKTAFYVSIPISALELRYLDPFTPTMDVIGLWALWSRFAGAFIRRSPSPA